jgi:ferritin
MVRTKQFYHILSFMNKRIEEVLNKQIELEARSSHHYLSMASWSEIQGYNGVASFLYLHSDEEREHMLKLVKFVNERGGTAIIPALAAVDLSYDSLHAVFTDLLNHEVLVTQAVNEIVFICLEEKDYTTHTFMQWYVSEQLEEEALARTILDKLKLVGSEKSGLYLFDRDIENFQANSVANGEA